MDASLNILIVEDDMLISEMLKEILFELGHTVVGQVKNGEEARILLDNSENALDLVFLDINLRESISGIELAEKLNHNYSTPFIYLSSYSDKKTLRKASETQPFAYLIKPFTKQDIQVPLIMFLGEKEKFVIIKDSHLKVKIKTSAICCIRSENNYLQIQTKNKKYVIRQSLDGFLAELDDSNIVRIHRSHAVQLSSISAVNGQYVLVNNEKYPLSRKYRDEVLTRFSS